MQVRRLINNDYSFGNNRNDFIEGDTAILQACKTKLRQLKGEWFLDSRDGVEWGDYLGHKINDQKINKLIKAKLKTIDGVLTVSDLIIIRSGRDIEITCTIGTEDNSIELEYSFNALEDLANDATD